ncbi:hypothetical protein M011DRAFT_17202 [Sporormia fimetaria CBS 119925]|uniref:Uncharacterized protein n=1 Tax=Sporormia fimetaria CBS 119925 TaxID=1340428 RepID=A0A6A6VNE5_9PLEO|nr:hypothetical protein M011DRAFT_17202 [Sporormia fimetaria CBS 119925]
MFPGFWTTLHNPVRTRESKNSRTMLPKSTKAAIFHATPFWRGVPRVTISAYYDRCFARSTPQVFVFTCGAFLGFADELLRIYIRHYPDTRKTKRLQQTPTCPTI